MSVAALGSDGTEIAATSTEQNGSYVLKVTGPGAYNIRVSLAAFAATTREVTLTAAECRGRLDVSLTLASRAPAPATSPIASGASAPNAVAGAAPATSSNPTPPARGAGAGRGTQPGTAAAGRGRGGFQQLDVVTNAAGETAAASTADDATANLRAELQLPPGFSTDAPTETVATAGDSRSVERRALFGGRGGRGEFGEGGPDGRVAARWLWRAGGRFGGGGGRWRRAGGGGPGGGAGRIRRPGGFGGMRGGGRIQGNANYTLGGFDVRRRRRTRSTAACASSPTTCNSVTARPLAVL